MCATAFRQHHHAAARRQHHNALEVVLELLMGACAASSMSARQHWRLSAWCQYSQKGPSLPLNPCSLIIFTLYWKVGGNLANDNLANITGVCV